MRLVVVALVTIVYSPDMESRALSEKRVLDRRGIPVELIQNDGTGIYVVRDNVTGVETCSVWFIVSPVRLYKYDT